MELRSGTVSKIFYIPGVENQLKSNFERIVDATTTKTVSIIILMTNKILDEKMSVRKRKITWKIRPNPPIQLSFSKQ